MERSKKHLEADQFVNYIFMQTPVAIMVLLGRNYEVALANEMYLQLVDKKKDIVGKLFFEASPEFRDKGIKEMLDMVWQTGEVQHSKEMEYRMLRNKIIEKCYFDLTYHPKRSPNDDTIIGIIVIAVEVTNQVLVKRKLAMHAMMVSEFLMAAPGFVCTLKGPDHVFDLINEKYQQLFGTRQIHGKPMMVALPELEGQGIDLLLDNVYTTGNPYSGTDIPIQMARGENLEPELGYFNFSYQPIYNENKEIHSILVFGYEVTEQMNAKLRNAETLKTRTHDLEEKVKERTLELSKLNETLQLKKNELEIAQGKILSDYSRRLIEASLDPLVTISASGKVMDVNDAFAQCTGLSRKELVGTDFKNYFTDPKRAKEAYKEVFSLGYITNFPLTIIDGTLTDVLFNGSVYKSEKGKAKGAVLVGRDITEQKKHEKELTESKVLAELARSLAEEAKFKAESATQLANNALQSKQQFLSNMSHEIRTPMNAIIGFTKVVLKTDISLKQREYLTAIKVSGDSLIVLINDILDLAKVDSGKMEFEKTPFKITSSISTMAHLFEAKIQEKNLLFTKTIDERIPAVVVGDSIRLHQIIINLMSNAVKFTSKGHVSINVTLISQDDKELVVEFSVIDTGIGIPKEVLNDVFENFQQASSETSRLYGGTGLGLAIVKKLVETQGGSIKVKSQVNEGSIFSFTLPFLKTDKLADIETELMDVNFEKTQMRVLVAEDMPLNQLLMKTLLEEFGFDKDIVANGKLAIEKLETQAYDIILMDLQMPEMNGFEATDYIRNTLKSTIPIIALTADVTTVDLTKCKQVGMNDYIAKPVDERVLYNKIMSLTKKTSIAVPTLESENTIKLSERIRCIDLEYLNLRTKSNPSLMMEIINLYLEQTPTLLATMKQSLHKKDWKNLYSAVHKMIPSFLIMGIANDYELMAKKVQDYASLQSNETDILDMISKIDTICIQACEELLIELENMKNKIK